MDQKPQRIAKDIPDHSGSKSLGATFRYALQGFVHTVKTQRNMKFHLVAATLAVLAAVLLRLNRIEWSLIAICIGLVLAAELLNTALEAMVDIAAPEFHPKAKIAKDAAAAAVLVCAVLSVVVGLLVFATALNRLLGL
jgi:diacylglycerol kinase